MKKDIFEDHWRKFKGKVKEKWGKLSEKDIAQIGGKKERLIALLQKRYGYEKERAEQELDAWQEEELEEEEEHHPGF